MPLAVSYQNSSFLASAALCAALCMSLTPVILAKWLRHLLLSPLDITLHGVATDPILLILGAVGTQTGGLAPLYVVQIDKKTSKH